MIVILVAREIIIVAEMVAAIVVKMVVIIARILKNLDYSKDSVDFITIITKVKDMN